MEHNAIFYLRHLLSLDDIKINISYTIIWHMRIVVTTKNYSLYYFSFIHRIVKGHGLILPLTIIEKLRVLAI
jgi:hypothetical protein